MKWILSGTLFKWCHTGWNVTVFEHKQIFLQTTEAASHWLSMLQLHLSSHICHILLWLFDRELLILIQLSKVIGITDNSSGRALRGDISFTFNFTAKLYNVWCDNVPNYLPNNFLTQLTLNILQVAWFWLILIHNTASCLWKMQWKQSENILFHCEIVLYLFRWLMIMWLEEERRHTEREGCLITMLSWLIYQWISQSDESKLEVQGGEKWSENINIIGQTNRTE